MSTTLSIEIPQLAFWLLRLTRAPGLSLRFNQDPVLFAHWYAAVGTSALVHWPEEVLAIQKAQRARKLSFDRAMALLSKASVQVGDRASIQFARDLLEGFEVHEWIASNPAPFDLTLRASLSSLASMDSDFLEEAFASSPLTRRLREMRTAMSLSRLEADLILLALACAASSEIQRLVELLVKDRFGSLAPLWATTLGYSANDIVDALGPKGILRSSGLLQVRGREGIPEVAGMWLELLAASDETTLFDSILEPLPSKAGAGIPARLQAEDRALAVGILSRPSSPGVNLLLYGAEGLEKRAMLQELTTQSKRPPFSLRRDDRFRSREYPTLVYVAQHLLRAAQPDGVLVVDRPLDVLERRPSEFLRMILGIEVDSSHIRPFDELVLEDNPAPTLWINVAAESLSEEILARFVFHAKLQRASKAELKDQLARLLADLKLTKKTSAVILGLKDVSALQLQTARRAAKLSGAKTRAEVEAALLQALRRSLSAMSRDTAPREKECVTNYSLEYLNCAGRFGPEKVMKALSVRPKGSLCLYGLPGTGKTQFVEYLAAQLQLPLISKRASDLLSKYVGDNEKNIAAMFAEAEAEEAILFLDEGDSFLRDRSFARQEWEVTKVNELLQHMERFPGIFIVATNLFKGLDQAALRRFTFKLEFLALDMDQRLRMFLSETGLGQKHGQPAAQIEAWHTELMLMPHLTAGDFATVKRQILLLDEPLTPAQWVEQLRIECSVKAKDLSAQSRMLGGDE